MCIGKYEVPYDAEDFVIKNKLFSPMLCENCDELAESVVLINNGDQLIFNVTFSDSSKIPTLSNGPLRGKGKYRFHGVNWRQEVPDEWSWNNVSSFPAELHITFYSLKYRNFEEAVEKNEGIAILSMMFRVRIPYFPYSMASFHEILSFSPR